MTNYPSRASGCFADVDGAIRVIPGEQHDMRAGFIQGVPWSHVCEPVVLRFSCNGAQAARSVGVTARGQAPAKRNKSRAVDSRSTRENSVLAVASRRQALCEFLVEYLRTVHLPPAVGKSGDNLAIFPVTLVARGA